MAVGLTVIVFPENVTCEVSDDTMKVTPPVARLTSRRTPVPACTASLKVRTMLALSAMLVELSAGELVVSSGAVVSGPLSLSRMVKTDFARNVVSASVVLRWTTRPKVSLGSARASLVMLTVTVLESSPAAKLIAWSASAVKSPLLAKPSPVVVEAKIVSAGVPPERVIVNVTVPTPSLMLVVAGVIA